MADIFNFLFGTRMGVLALFIGGVVLFTLIAFIMERRTHKLYVDRGPKGKNEKDGFWD